MSSSSSASPPPPPFGTTVDINTLHTPDEIAELHNLRPRELNKMSDRELMQVIDRIRRVNDDAEPYDLFLSHIQCFAQVIWNTRMISDRS
jgi:hypothetical protein